MTNQQSAIGGVYSNHQIKQAIKTGQIVCRPYNSDHLAGSSLDITLGHWYYRTERNLNRNHYNPFNKDDVDRYFEGPKKAVSHQEWAHRAGRRLLDGIPANHPVIALYAGERILAHSHEFVGIKAPGSSSLQARSTWGRNGVAICMDAGWGDPGYINRWTMEIYNLNHSHSIVLPVGERVAQIVFYHTGPVDGQYQQMSGKYQTQTQDNIDDIIKNWHPRLMLPRTYKDKRTLPVEL